MRRNFRSLLFDHLWPLRYGADSESTEKGISALALHLQILRSAPEPELSNVRRRVLEAAELEKRHAVVDDVFSHRKPRYASALLILGAVLCIGIIGFIALHPNHVKPEDPFFGLFWSPGLDRTTAAATFSTGTVVNEATPGSNPSPVRMELVLTVVPGRTQLPPPIVEPTPSPFLTLTRSSQGSGTH
jgi:hypothetical protein